MGRDRFRPEITREISTIWKRYNFYNDHLEQTNQPPGPLSWVVQYSHRSPPGGQAKLSTMQRLEIDDRKTTTLPSSKYGSRAISTWADKLLLFFLFTGNCAILFSQSFLVLKKNLKNSKKNKNWNFRLAGAITSFFQL